MKNNKIPINKYKKSDSVKVIATRHGMRGLVVTTTLVNKDKQNRIEYYTRVTNVIKWPMRGLYWIGYLIIPNLSVFLERLFDGDKKIFKSSEYKEARKSYREYYYNLDLTAPITTGDLYSDQYVPNWIDKNNEEQFMKYANAFSIYASKSIPKQKELAVKYLNTDVPSTLVRQLVISYMAGITPPGDLVNKTKDVKSSDLYDD